MDSIDRKIIELLKMNSRITSSEISRQIHLSVPAVSERIRKLEEGGIIQRFTVKLNREKSGILLVAFIMVQLEKPEHIPVFKELVLKDTRVLECHHIAGGYDYRETWNVVRCDRQPSVFTANRIIRLDPLPHTRFRAGFTHSAETQGR